MNIRRLAVAFGSLLPFLPAQDGLPGGPVTVGISLAADSLTIDGLSKDPRQFRVQVTQMLTKVDSLIDKLKANPQNQAIVLDLLQTRDDILREITKIETAPGDAKWTSNEMRESVQAKLKLLKDQYDKATGIAG